MVGVALKPISGDRRAEQVRETLSRLAMQLGPNSKLPSTRDLVKSLGVSQATLRSALGNMELQGVIHRRRGSGVYVSPTIQLRSIAVVLAHGVFEARSATYDHILFRALQPAAKAHNFRVTYHFADVELKDDQHGPHQLAIDAGLGRVDAMVIRGPIAAHSEEVQALKIPRVFLTSHNASLPRVESDVATIIRRGVQLLAEAGCKRIGFGFPDFPVGGAYPESVQVFKDSVEAAGLQFSEQWLLAYPLQSLASRPLQSLSRFHRQWQEWPSRPDGLLSTDDQFTSGVVHACKILQLRIPEQLVIASHANKGLELFDDAPVIRLELDPAETAEAMFATLDELLGQSKAVTQVRTVLHHEIIPPEISHR